MLSCYLFTLLKLGSVKKNAKILLKEDNMDIHISNSISQLHFFSNSMAQDKIKKGWGVKKKKKKLPNPPPNYSIVYVCTYPGKLQNTNVPF